MNKVIVVFALIFLVSCAAQPETETVEVVKYRTVNIEQPKKILPKPESVKMRDVRWKIIKDNGEPYFSLDTSNYQNLTLNTRDLLAYIEKSNAIIDSHNR